MLYAFRIDETLAVEALKKLVGIDGDWVPDAGTSLHSSIYYCNRAPLGVHPSSNYQFIIITDLLELIIKKGLIC